MRLLFYCERYFKMNIKGSKSGMSVDECKALWQPVSHDLGARTLPLCLFFATRYFPENASINFQISGQAGWADSKFH